MNPVVYQVQKDGQFTTVKSFNDPVGVVRGLYGIVGRFLSQVKVNDKVTIVDGNITVTVVDLPLSWVKWCPYPPYYSRKITSHVINHKTWLERWFINSYLDGDVEKWEASRFGVHLGGYMTLDGLITQLNTRAN